MISSYLKISNRFTKSNKSMSISIVICISLTIALVLSLVSFGDNSRKSIDLDRIRLYGNVDIILGYNSGSSKLFDTKLIKDIESIPEINKVSEVLVDNLEVSNINDQALKNTSVYTVGVNNDDLSKSRFKFTKNLKENEVSLNKSFSEMIKVNVGDYVNISNKIKTEKCRVVEIIPDVAGDLNKPDVMITNRAFMKKFLQINGEAAYVIIEKNANFESLPIATKLTKIDKEFKVDLIENDEYVTSNLQNLHYFLAIFSVISLIMITLFIISIFHNFIYKYRKNFATIRAIGGSAFQGFSIIFLQAFYLISIGAIIGYILSFIFNNITINVFQRYFSNPLLQTSFPWLLNVKITLMCGIFISIIMIVPAIGCAKIPPIQIMQNNEKLNFSMSKGRKKFSILILLTGIGFVICGIRHRYSSNMEGLFGGILIALFVIITFSYIIKPVLTKLLPVVSLIGGRINFIAVKNLIPQVKKNTLIILSIASAMLITIVGSTTIKSIKVNTEQTIRNEFYSDIVISSRYGLDTKLNHDFKTTIDRIDGVSSSIVLSNAKAGWVLGNGKYTYLYMLCDFKELEDKKIINLNGDYKNKIIVSAQFAKQHSIKVGDELTVLTNAVAESDISNKSNKVEKVKVSAILDKLPGQNFEGAYIDWSNNEFIDDLTNLGSVMLYINKDHSVDTVNALKELKRSYPELKWNTLTAAMNDFELSFMQRWSLFIAIMGIIIISVIFNIINLLNNYLQSKRREYSILRAMGISQKQIVKIIITQMTLFIVIGIILGTILGCIVLFSDALTLAGSIFYFDYMTLLYVIIILIVSCIIFMIPAIRKITKNQIIEDIRTE